MQRQDVLGRNWGLREVSLWYMGRGIRGRDVQRPWVLDGDLGFGASRHLVGMRMLCVWGRDVEKPLLRRLSVCCMYKKEGAETYKETGLMTRCAAANSFNGTCTSSQRRWQGWLDGLPGSLHWHRGERGKDRQGSGV